MKLPLLALATLLLHNSLPVHATIRLPALVGDHMVLQRDTKVPIWGWAAPGEKVTLTFQGKTYAAVPASTGKWQVTLPATPAGGPYTMTLRGQNTLTIQDILVGDVWLASGQSNMELPLRDPNAPKPNSYPVVVHAEQEVAAANFPQIRQFTVKKQVSNQPRLESEGYNWKLCSPSTAGQFAAVPYFFARDLHQHYKVPIGIISSPWGGTPAEAWVSGEALKVLPDFQAKVVEVEKQTTPENNDPNTPTGLFNGMIAPLIPYAVKGIIWYQGESNANRAEQYRTLFPTLIKDWRGRWGYDVPFLFVQLANFKETEPEPAESDWAELREAQALALTLPRTGMAVAIDIGDGKDIHPANKQDVGHRLALVARKVAYNDKQVVAAGPTFQSMRVTGNKVQLRFTDAGSGLQVKGSNGVLKGFAVAGADKKFHWATAKLEGQQVVVSSEAVPTPVAVRYAWASNPEATLYNREGLPAAPFRTDQWEGVTHGKK
ncbi:sialate O-acetylesterase [Hymenobacter tibetensis]|uniref:Sialate O-acetylesterase n=1 Tax=Hymenobacter tibetensis TaxID=497967 RepID=A0ABY4CYT3_9BACT|nr:sialate O-acetylesterase [Hymenobacter tibetensis]UOG75415.1 sialate O-acetylesterase [Hymenobacter tibetensis]